MLRNPDLDAALLAAVVTSSNDAIVTKDLEGIVTSWNAAATRIFGYQAEEMVGEPITKIIPADLRSEEEDILGRIRRGERVEHFDTVRRTKEGSKIPVSLTISPLIDRNGRIMGASKIVRDISERKRSEERQRLLMNELRHRVKNTLSTVRAIAGQTYKGSELDPLNDKFSRRIAALAASSDLLIKDDWQKASLRELVDAVLMPFQSDETIRIRTETNIELTPRQATSLGLALNELATNATKYGSLSAPEGHVVLTWGKSSESEGSFWLEWLERGGPEISPPQRRGFGTDILTVALKHELGAETELRYAAEGVEFRMGF